MYVDDFGTIFQCEVNSDGDYIIWRELCDSNTIWGLFAPFFNGDGDYVIWSVMWQKYDMGLILHHFSIQIQWWWWLCHPECHMTKIWYRAHFALFFNVNSMVMVIMSSRVSCDKNRIWGSFCILFPHELNSDGNYVICHMTLQMT